LIEEGFLQKVLVQLKELQKLDSRLYQLESLRGDLPQQVDRLKRDMEEAEKELSENQIKLQTYQKEQGITELEIKALAGKRKKYQDQLFQVKNNREYDAVTHELEMVKTSVEQKENRMLELLDSETSVKEHIKTFKVKMEEFNIKLEARTGELKKRLAETGKEEAALNNERIKILKNINSRHLAMYERIRNAKNGSAVVPVIRNACGGCYNTLPPQRILEIRQMNRLFICEVCGRILVWDEAVSEKTV
jgi:predicted  nucleic acid-binding Zn-ribbon protein